MEANRALYRVMGVSRDATQAQLKKAYHNLARRYHPDKNAEDGARFTEISNAYNLLSDPRKRQLYDQFGDQGVQMADVMAQQGVPDWILMPAAQRMVGMVVCGMVVLFVVLLPLFLLLRSDEEVDWPWGVAAIPVWLLDALCFAVVAARIAYEVAQAKEMSAIICSDTGATVAYFVLVLLVQILLVVRLDNPSSALTYTSALVPFYLAMAPSICSAAYALAGAAYRRWRPLPATPPVTLLQMEPYLHALAGRVLLCLTLWLAGLKGDGVITANWWLVLLPLWIQMVLLAVRWQRALESVLAGERAGASGSSSPPEEERVARIAGLVLSAIGYVLIFACLLLLSLRAGGQTHYAATTIGMPVFATLGIAVCCCGCLSLCARGIQAAQQRHANGHPPYTEVTSDEEAASRATDSAAATPRGSRDADAGDARGAAAPTRGAAACNSGGCSSSSTDQTHEQETASAADRMADAVAHGLEISADPGQEEAPRCQASDPAGTPSSVAETREQKEERLSRLSTKELKHELAEMGVPHEHCLEKGELLKLLLDAGGGAVPA